MLISVRFHAKMAHEKRQDSWGNSFMQMQKLCFEPHVCASKNSVVKNTLI